MRSVHEEYFSVGVDRVETNTFGSNHSAASEYEIGDRIVELSEAGARSPAGSPTSSAPGTGGSAGCWVRWVRLPAAVAGRIGYDMLRDGYQQNAEGLRSPVARTR
ncbi:homocysteine S-methyltransferase family protein [Streptomyces thinghirensis]|nr:homocysteine S-methyltransferase family protein [Streptomyces thinghirensis]